MSAKKSPEPKQAPMYLDERLSEGFVIVCAGDGGEHSFVLRGLGPSIECPQCGRTALSSQLIDAYYERLVRIAGCGAATGRIAYQASGPLHRGAAPSPRLSRW
jgi:hypothetical protein